MHLYGVAITGKAVSNCWKKCSCITCLGLGLSLHTQNHSKYLVDVKILINFVKLKIVIFFFLLTLKSVNNFWL